MGRPMFLKQIPRHMQNGHCEKHPRGLRDGVGWGPQGWPVLGGPEVVAERVGLNVVMRGWKIGLKGEQQVPRPWGGPEGWREGHETGA